MWNLSGRRKDITRGGSVKVTSAPGSSPCCLLPGTHDANRPLHLVPATADRRWTDP